MAGAFADSARVAGIYQSGHERPLEAVSLVASRSRLQSAWQCFLGAVSASGICIIGGCSDTTEAVDQTYVTIQSPSPVVLRGDQLELTAAVWMRNSAGDSVEVPNAELLWTTDDPTLATLMPKDNRTVVATGVNSGTVQIRAVATGFQGSGEAVYPLRVSNPLEIDSMRPTTVRYGEKLTMYGVGVSTLFLASLQGAALLPDTFSVAAGAGGVSQFSFWVPPPAASGHALVLSPGQIVVASDSTTVLRRDLFEPNETAPSVLGLSNPPFPTPPAVRFYNPALAFEERVRADSLGVDWYRMTGITPGTDLTFIFQAPTFKSAHLTFLASPVNTADSVASPGWTIGSGLYACKNHSFKVEEQPSDSLIIALKNVPAGALDLISLFFITGRYGLAVVQGYLTADATIKPDRLEENDNCEFADRNFADPQLRVDLSKAYSDTRTIDNPHDIDWIRFHVPGLLPQVVTLRTAPRLANLSKPGDIDLYVIGIPQPGSPLDLKGSSRTEGSNEALTLILDPGDYYMVVTDFGGVPTRYSVCAAVGSSCTLPPSSVVGRVPALSRNRMPAGGAQ
jgi:hypothetical protein